MRFSFIIPARNEQGLIRETVTDLARVLEESGTSDYEIIIVDDASTDATPEIANQLAEILPACRAVTNQLPIGFGNALRHGLASSRGEFVIFFMGDRSDDVNDVPKYLVAADDGYDCVFGSRFMPSSTVENYPLGKLFINRCGNYMLKFLFRYPGNDLTNAFKLYRRTLLADDTPFTSQSFSITVEFALKAWRQRPRLKQIPINWIGRRQGTSKFFLLRACSDYFRICYRYYRQRKIAGPN